MKAKLNIEDYLEQIHLAVVELGKASLFLRYNWFQNPVINQSKFTLLFKRYFFYSRRMFWNKKLKEKKKAQE